MEEGSKDAAVTAVFVGGFGQCLAAFEDCDTEGRLRHFKVERTLELSFQKGVGKNKEKTLCKEHRN